MKLINKMKAIENIDKLSKNIINDLKKEIKELDVIGETMEIKTTNQIIHDSWNNGSLLEATKYVCSTEFKKNQIVNWVRIEDIKKLILDYEQVCEEKHKCKKKSCDGLCYYNGFMEACICLVSELSQSLTKDDIVSVASDVLHCNPDDIVNSQSSPDVYVKKDDRKLSSDSSAGTKGIRVNETLSTISSNDPDNEHSSGRDNLKELK